MKNTVKITILSLLAAAVTFTAIPTRAQDAAPATSGSSTNAPAMHKKKAGALPFKGKIATLDASAGTFTVGELSFNVTSTTKISTNNVPATLADFKVGDSVTGSYKKAADGKLTVGTLKLGGAKKKKAEATAAQ